MDRPEDIGRRLRAAREYLGLSQAAFAERMGGIGQSSIARYEKGELPDERRLRHLLEDWARVCEVPADWFTAEWSKVGTTTTTTSAQDDLEPTWVGRLEDQIGLLIGVVGEIYPDVTNKLLRDFALSSPGADDAQSRRQVRRPA